MASNATIGALRVTLGADTAAFDKGLKSAESSLSRFAKNIGTIAAGVGLERALQGVISGIVSGMKSVFKEADDIGKAAQRIGITVEELSKLKYAADISDVSMETLEKSATKLSRSMADAVADKTSKAALQFRALGIDVRNADGSFKSVSTVMIDMSNKFATMSDGATKTAASMNLMGRGGTQMVPMLNQGGKAITDLMKEAEALGAVITTQVANSADRMSDDFKRLTTANKALSNSIIQELAPVMGVLTDRFIAWLSEGQKVSNVGITIVDWMLRIAETAMRLGAAISRTGEEIGAFARQAKAFITLDWEGVAKAQNEMAAAGDNMRRKVFENAGAFALIRQEAAKLRDELGQTTTRQRDYGAELAKGKNALDEFFKSQAKAIAGQRAEAETVGLLAGAKESLKVILQAHAIAQENNIRLTAAQQERLAALAGEARNAALTLAGAQLTEESLTPWEKLEKKLREINELYLVGAINSETAGRASRNAALAAGQTWEQVTAAAAGGFAQLANEMGKSSEKMFNIGKALGIVEATINTYVAFTKALASAAPPFNYIAAAGVLAAGIAKVIAIKSQQPPKMATGGAIRMGGFGGVDSQLLQARIRPDEQVDIWRPGEGPDPRRGAGGGTIIVKTDELSRPLVEKLVAGINELMGDRGGTKLATA